MRRRAERTAGTPAPTLRPEPAVRYDDLRDRLDERTRTILERRRLTPIRRIVVRRLLPLADITGVVIAFVVASLLTEGTAAGAYRSRQLPELAALIATLPVWLGFARLYGLYRHDDERADHSTADDAPGVLNMVTLGVWLFYGVAELTRVPNPHFGELFAFWGLAIVTTLAARTVVRALARASLAFTQNAVILGAGEVGQLLGRKLSQHPEYGINLVGFVDEEPAREPRSGQPPLLGSPERLREITRALDVDRVIVAFTGAPDEHTLRHVRMLTDAEIRVDIVPRLFEVIGAGTDVHSVEGVPLLSLPPLRLPRWARLLKRLLDLVGAVIALVFALPVLAVAALLVKLDSPGPVFFSQTRIGEGGRPFRIWKLRTMTADADGRKEELTSLNKHRDADPRMFKICGDPRVTRVGGVLRRLSVDELPQLFNVLRGQMSLVGPRPLIPDEHRHVTDWAHTRGRLRPGITGMWQVLGRSDIPFDEMVRLDYLYVTTWSLWSDIRLLARTFSVLRGSRGAY